MVAADKLFLAVPEVFARRRLRVALIGKAELIGVEDEDGWILHARLRPSASVRIGGPTRQGIPEASARAVSPKRAYYLAAVRPCRRSSFSPPWAPSNRFGLGSLTATSEGGTMTRMLIAATAASVLAAGTGLSAGASLRPQPPIRPRGQLCSRRST